MGDFDSLLAILDSAEDVVASSWWGQSLEPTPIREDELVIPAAKHQPHHNYNNRDPPMKLLTSLGGNNRIGGLQLAHVFDDEGRDHRPCFFPVIRPPQDPSRYSAPADHRGNGIFSKICFDGARPCERSTMGPIATEVAAETQETNETVSIMTDVIQSSPSSSDGSEASIVSDGRFRSYQVGQWQERFEELLLFGKAYGHLLVPHSYPPNQKLAQWVKRQRHQYKRKNLGHHSTLSDERVALLLDAGFVFDSHKAVWYLRFQTLRAFHKVHGHCNIPTHFRDSSLTVWLKHQRRQYSLYQKGLKSTMNEERIQLMDSIGLDWNPRNLIKS
jgi:Helicase associated domain